MKTPRFATLGPAGTNHEYVALKYLAFHALDGAPLRLAASVEEIIDDLRAHRVDYGILCAVHPQTPRAVGRHYREIFVVDTFVSPSLPLAVLARSDVANPRSIGLLHPSTTDYVDGSMWERRELITSGTLHAIADGLVAGRYDAAVTYSSYLERCPNQLRLLQELGSPDDAWLVLGRERTFTEPLLANADAPIVKQFAMRQA